MSEPTTAEPWGARMGRLEAETGGECGAGALARDPETTREDIIMRGLSYEPVSGPYTHRRWWRIELAHQEQPMGPSGCIQAFTFWLGERAIYG